MSEEVRLSNSGHITADLVKQALKTARYQDVEA